MRKKILLLLITISTLFVSCFEDLDDNIQTASDLDIENFIYRGLNYFYLYKADTPQLANDNFANQGELNTFLNSFQTPESLFSFLKSPQDRFSLLVANYNELENALNGVSLNNGMEFGLVYYPNNSSNVFGYVRYVLPGTDAESKNLERGMIFNSIDGQQLTDTNFSELLSLNSYEIGLATFDGTAITPTGEIITLVKQQYTENPILIAETLTVQGQKIGYLMYNAFTRDFDSQLNGVFAQFKADAITNLVIDLRYNGGGSVQTAIDLSSMITGQFYNQVFANEEWNTDRQAEYASPKLFDNQIFTGEAINSLNLTKTYVLTTKRSASASELVINGLNPYIDMTQVGDTTTGKYQASFLLYDAPAPNFSKSQANPGHTYAMLPLVFKTSNAVGFTDYAEGLFPDIQLKEDYTNLGVLGDVNEPLLAAALNDILSIPQPQPRTTTQFNELLENKIQSPIYQLMIAEQ
ncbi:S41 family peptidase [Flavobacteriaceae bacterium]|nr:S41 family peptidase [Flavobacteriaceae bacterium]